MRSRFTMPNAARFVTAQELERYPEDDWRYELAEGRVIRMSPVGYEHGRVVARLLYLLERHFRSHRTLGAAMTEVGFKLASDPDTVRAPDVAFLRHERIPAPPARGFVNGPPDLAMEVLSPDDTPSAIGAKVDEYLSQGVTLVVVVNPDEKTVTSCRRLLPPVTSRSGDERLDLDDVIPGFSCSLEEIFD
jgi:Uma2 family endonuclease